MQGWTRKLELRCFRCPNPVWLPTCILSSHTWPRSEFANCFAQLRRIICEVAPRRKFALNFLAALLGPPRVSPGCSSCPLSSLSTINSSRLLHARELRRQLGFIWRTPPLSLLAAQYCGRSTGQNNNSLGDHSGLQTASKVKVDLRYHHYNIYNPCLFGLQGKESLNLDLAVSHSARTRHDT